jgi:hypothetical protein
MTAPARSFKVMYTHVTRLLTLSKPDGKTIVFVSRSTRRFCKATPPIRTL